MIQIHGGTFQYPDGTPVVNGTLTLTLSTDAKIALSPFGQVCAGQTYTADLDSSGNVPSSPVHSIWSNAELIPSGSYYTAKVFNSSGALVLRYSNEIWVFTQPDGSNVDLSTIIPSTPSGISFAEAVVKQPIALQEILFHPLQVDEGVYTGTTPQIKLFGDTTQTVTLLDSNTLNAQSIFTSPALGGDSESAAIYIKPNITGSGDNKVGILLEVPATQPDTSGAAIKIVHFGQGDAEYIAQFAANGTALEAASFIDGTKGIISTIQYANPFFSTLFNALWGSASVPGFGMFYADQAPGNAFVARRFDDGQNPDQLMFTVVGTDLVPSGGITSDGSFSGPRITTTGNAVLGGKVTSYNGTSTVGGGITAVVALADLTSQSGATSATTLFTPPADGFYRLSVALKITTTGTSPVYGPVTVTYTDADGSVAQSQVMLLRSSTGSVVTTTVNNSTTTGTVNGDMVFYAKSGVDIKYAIAASGTFGTGRASAHLRLELL